MKILLTNCYSHQNKGDAAIVSVMISEIKKTVPYADLSISTMEDVDEHKFFEKIPLVTSFFYECIYRYTNPIYRLFMTFYIVIASLFWAFFIKYFNLDISILFQKRIINLLKKYSEADLIIGVGGAYLMGDVTIRGFVTLLLHLHNFVIAKLLKKPVVLYSQSIGPFPNRIQSNYAAFILNKLDKIIVREKISLKYLEMSGVRKTLIYVSVDAAFLFPDKNKKAMRQLLQKKGVVFGRNKYMITLKSLKGDKAHSYEKIIAQCADYLLTNSNNQVIFIPQTTSFRHNDDDRNVMDSIKKQMKFSKKAIFIKDELSHYDIKSLYQYADILIATRMHSAIFALTGLIPTIAIAYEHKTTGIMKDLNLEQWVIPLEKLNFVQLKQKIKQMQKNKRIFKRTLQENLPVYLSQAKKTVAHLQEFFHVTKNSGQEKIQLYGFSKSFKLEL